MPTLRIYMLGDLRLFYGAEPLPPFPTRSTRALFAYLVAHRQRAFTRPHLAGVFWGDYPEGRAQRNLNTTLWRLRRSLPAEFLIQESDTLAFDPASDYWLDVVDFEAGCAPAPQPLAGRVQALESALALYRGDFLEGWYEDWALLEAERLRLVFLGGLQDLAEAYQLGSNLTQALAAARRLLAADPLREDSHRRLIGLYAALGQRQAALQQYEACRQVLRAELGIEPAPETVALTERLRSGRRGAPPPGAGQGAPAGGAPRPAPAGVAVASPGLPRSPFDDFGLAPLLGRDPELAGIQGWLKAEAPLLAVAGEAGVGKTALALAAASQAAAQGWTVLWGGCQDLPAPPPYQALLAALRCPRPEGGWNGLESLPRLDPFWLEVLSALLPELPAAGDHSAYRRAAGDHRASGAPAIRGPAANRSVSGHPAGGQPDLLPEALARLLEALAGRGPHLLVLEDLHWADPASLDLLAALASRLQPQPFKCLLTYRPEETLTPPPLLAALDAPGLLRRLALGRLAPAAAAALVQRSLGLPDEPASLARFVYHETDGNPFFILEVLKSLVEEGYLRLRASGEGWDSPWDWEGRELLNLLPPQGIRQAIQRRLQRLSPASRSLLELAAVFSHDFDLDLLRQAGGGDEQAALEATNDLLRRGLIVEDGDRLRFGHDKIRQGVYQGLPGARCRQLHLQAGLALENWGSPDPARPAAEPVSSSGSASGSPAELLAHHFYLAEDYSRALPYCLQAGRRLLAVYANRSALTYASWAVDCARRTGAGGPAALAAWELRGAIWEHLGQYDETLADYAAMRQAAEAGGDRAALARATRSIAWVRGDHLGEWEAGLAGAQTALDLAHQAGDELEAARARLNLGACQNMLGRSVAALENYSLALDGFRQAGDRVGEAATLQNIATAYQFQCRYAEALAAARQALGAWQALGSLRPAAKVLTNLGYLAINLGRLEEAEAAFLEASATLRQIGALPAIPWALVGLGAARRLLGRWEQAIAALDEADELERQSSRSSYIQALILYHRGMAEIGLGRRGPALANLEKAVVQARQSGVVSIYSCTLSALGRCRRQAGDLPAAAFLHAEALTLPGQPPQTRIIAASELGLDQVCTGAVEPGLAALHQAVQDCHDQTETTRAECLLNLAEGLFLAGHPDFAHPPACQALALAGPLHLAELCTHAEKLLAQINP